MRPHWMELNDSDQRAYRAVAAFLNDRLAERATIDWGLRLKPRDHVKKAAILDLVEESNLKEPWRTAWRLIEESWATPDVERRASTRPYQIASQLKSGDRSGIIIRAIADFVAPKIEVSPFSESHLQFYTPPKRPKLIGHLFSVRLTSTEIVSPDTLGLRSVQDRKFFVELAHALDAVVIHGLDAARRIGWTSERQLWLLGQLNRVYFVSEQDRPPGEHEPDEFHRGIAPSVKLLHFVVSRLVDLELAIAKKYSVQWLGQQTPIHTRLWAALARDQKVVPADEVAAFLLSLNDSTFWDQNTAPEISELRAVRFGEFEPPVQMEIIKRIRRRPPRSQWARKVDPERIEKARLYWAVRELRRIEIAGVALPAKDKAWLDSHIAAFPELTAMTRLDDGFIGTQMARSIEYKPDNRYDLLSGEDRLEALEGALGSARGGWDDDTAERAAGWITQRGNIEKVLADFESVPHGGAAFPRVWDRFGWAHSPSGQEDTNVQVDRAQSERTLSLLEQLSDDTLEFAISGLSHWLSSWRGWVAKSERGLRVWHRLWPIAVRATNGRPPAEDQIDLQTVARSSGDDEPLDLDTLNTPAGKLIDVFLARCPRLSGEGRPFETDRPLLRMRETVIKAEGRAGLIVKHRMIEALHYFLRADSAWTRTHLVEPLLSDSVEALALWRAIARHTHFNEALKIIGVPMTQRAVDKRLGRETRSSLVFSLVVEALHSFREAREPAVPYARIQQMIRSLDDEVRAHGAGTIQRFVQQVSSPHDAETTPSTAEELFRSAARPFLQQVWPQERSLSTPGVSRALADLPATTQNAFAETVDVIERFLVPFECWSMLDYGLYGESDGEAKLSMIDDQPKADAFLRLLDLTIGNAETSVIPMDLGDALNQVRKVAPGLAATQAFRRLATAARRT